MLLWKHHIVRVLPCIPGDVLYDISIQHDGDMLPRAAGKLECLAVEAHLNITFVAQRNIKNRSHPVTPNIRLIASSFILMPAGFQPPARRLVAEYNPEGKAWRQELAFK